MMLILFLCFLALCAAAPLEEKNTKLQRGGCPPFWYGFNGRCFRYVAAHRTWIDAERHCVSQGANLVSIHRVQEHEFVRLLIANFDSSHGRTWIGLTDHHQNSKWIWSDGSRVDFFFWSPRQPNNYRGESCVETNWGPTKRWNDYHCNARFPSVCALRTARP
ncbi:lactose-binding lectin l-2-like [Salarias fasciatus]|uniref:lactose-binding lectin l-2-like n=1 Tax=Salarias fasciatus TaxID=181472 RepID=UPI0011770CA8|nr:lactose-binding lectin l-2-like [Salarias fasciatus]